MKQCYYRFTAAAAVLLALALALCGCSSGGNQAAAEETDAGGSGGSNFWNSEENGASAGTPANLNVTVDYSDFDVLDTWDDDACSIELHGGSPSISGSGAEAEQREYYVVKITEGGTYVISGSLENGQIYVEAGENQVHLVLNGAKLSCKASAPIYINNGRKTVITLAAGTENVLTDGTDYTYAVTESDEETGEITGEPNAALFSKKALTINGSGSLSVTGNFNNGITCKDELKIMNGTITVTAQNHGIRGNDFVVIKGGSIAVAALEGDGIKSTKEEHAEKGYVYIENGTLSVTAGDDGIQAANFAAVKDGSISIACGKDGIHADGTLSISGGTIDIEKSCEGLEGLEINISGGKIHLTAEDDGLNASAGSTAGTDGWRGFGGGGGMQYDSSCQIHLSGGYLYINADGDGIDSNGDLTISGGSRHHKRPCGQRQRGSGCQRNDSCQWRVSCCIRQQRYGGVSQRQLWTKRNRCDAFPAADRCSPSDRGCRWKRSSDVYIEKNVSFFDFQLAGHQERNGIYGLYRGILFRRHRKRRTDGGRLLYRRFCVRLRYGFNDSFLCRNLWGHEWSRRDGRTARKTKIARISFPA